MSGERHDWLSLTDAATLLGVTTRHLRGYERHGLLTAVREPNGRVRFPRGAIEQLAGQRAAPTALDVAARLGISTKQARRLLAEHGVPSLSGPRTRRYDPDAVAQLLAGRPVKPQRRHEEPWAAEDLQQIAAQVAKLFAVSPACMRARARDVRGAEARRALVWLLASLEVPIAQIATLVSRRAATVRRTLSVLGAAPPFASGLSALLVYWRERARSQAQQTRLRAALSDLSARLQEVLFAYIRCRLLGERHVEGRCECLAGLYHVRFTPGIREALVQALTAAGLTRHISRMEQDIIQNR